uniref:G-patch domain-containing protein n=1 Tax=Psilocybe cubensis TaxID=181762 RepID=A0A8H8CMT6_PSICU
MAYNREWDRGKDTWDDSYGWSDNRGNVREREEEYYGDGKRRKFNNGAYDNSHGYDGAGYENSYNRHQQHQDWSQDYGHDDHSRGGAGGFAKKRLVPSEPSPHVIFLGLDPDFTEADVSSGIPRFKWLQRGDGDNYSREIIRHFTFVFAPAHALTYFAVGFLKGTSKGFGFAQFTTVEHARAFVDPLFPFIQMPPPASHGASATAAFYKALETGAPHNGRRVKIDYSQSAMPHDKGRMNRGNMNDGTRDIGNAQSPVLLFRGLDPLSGPQAIYQAMLSSAGPGKEGAKGMRRIILIKDKVTMASFGFAFVEFVDITSASNVLAATMSAQLHPSGFRISDRPVAASFAHPYSFQPVTDFLQRDEACLTSTNSLGGMEGTWVRYWDESSTVAVLEFKVEEPPQQPSQSKDKKEKKKSKVDTDHAKATAAAPSALPISDKPVTLSFSKGPVKLNSATGSSKIPVLGFSLDDSNTVDDTSDEPPSEPSKPLVVKKVAPLIASKKTANNINKWNQVQEELAHDLPTQAAPVVKPVVSSSAGPSTMKPAVNVAAPKATTPPIGEVEFEFSDVASLTCLLCARQFKTIEQLKRHNKESDLHKANFKDSNLRDIARQKVASRKKEKESTPEQPKYRDRASERRTLFHQPDAPVLEKEIKKKDTLSRAPTPPPAPPTNPGKDESNVGNKLLKMMGWKEGTGLGSEGDGRVNPIETSVYTPGVGLGASKGKDIGKYTEGFTSYVHMAQDSVRK